MRDPQYAVWLYLAIIICAFLLTPRWGLLREAIREAGEAKKAKIGAEK